MNCRPHGTCCHREMAKLCKVSEQNEPEFQMKWKNGKKGVIVLFFNNPLLNIPQPVTEIYSDLE